MSPTMLSSPETKFWAYWSSNQMNASQWLKIRLLPSVLTSNKSFLKCLKRDSQVPTLNAKPICKCPLNSKNVTLTFFINIKTQSVSISSISVEQKISLTKSTSRTMTQCLGSNSKFQRHIKASLKLHWMNGSIWEWLSAQIPYTILPCFVSLKSKGKGWELSKTLGSLTTTHRLTNTAWRRSQSALVTLVKQTFLCWIWLLDSCK